MYKISVPIIANTAEKMGFEKHLEALKRLGAERVFVSVGEYYISPEKRGASMVAVKKCCDFFHKHGIEVGVWLWSFMLHEKNDFTHMKDIVNGTEGVDVCCPSDKRFRAFAADYLKELAACGVDLIQFDDDFRHGDWGFGLACACENHMDYVRELLDENISREELAKQALSGGKNRYRSAWQKSKKYYLELFAKEMRAAVDEINPKVRISLCSCMSVWDMDGTDSATLSRILAGSQKPILRLIGAPYWAVNRAWGNRLQNIIELERMERSWCGEGIEIMSEGDAYPRPRTNCPARYVEIFDTALRADGRFDGILKYDIDYISKPSFEEGYIKRHEKNRELYEKIDKHFGGKECCGVRVYERMNKFEDMLIPKEFEGTASVKDLFHSPASKILSDNSIPTTYEGEGVFGIAFAENVCAVSPEAMKKGLVIDLRGAELLKEMGIDVGLKEIGDEYTATTEYYDFLDDTYSVCNSVHDISISDSAKVLSHFTDGDIYFEGKHRSIGSYYYENADGQKFLVFAFHAYAQRNANENYSRGYMRSAELKYASELFGGSRLPAYSYGNPDLYILSKKNDDSMAVGLWNIFADEIIEPIVELDREYGEIEFINCSGRLEGDRVILSEIAPFGFAGFEVR